MSQRANCLAPRLLWFVRHCTPFVLCWGEGTSFSSQHASRWVLHLAKEDGYIPGWGRKMVVVDVVVAAGSTQQAQLTTQCYTACSTACYTAPYTACYSEKKRAQEGNCPSCALSIVGCLVGVFGGRSLGEKNVLNPSYFYQDEGHS